MLVEALVRGVLGRVSQPAAMSEFTWTDYTRMLLRREQLKLADLSRDEVAMSEWL